MNWGSALAIYFIIWWTVLFAVLPFGIKNAHETGSTVQEGNDAGAPTDHGIKWKAAVTTLVSAVIFAVLYVALTTGALEKLDLPFLRDMPKL
jgi:predicted secreted protein